MKKVTEIRSKNLRRDRNTELLRRMRSGEQLTSFNSNASWFPPRPIIEKDSRAIRQIYGADTRKVELHAVAAQDEAVPLRLA
jgi:hypothetical protein